MLEEYFSFDLKLIPEGRKAYALWRAVEVSSELTKPEDIIEKARVFEKYLEEGAETVKPAERKPKVQVVAKE